MNDRISLNIPAKPEYMLTARLAASSVASRMGFDINDIEDIKTAMAETLLMVIRQCSFSTIDIVFVNDGDRLTIQAEGVPGEAFEVDITEDDGSLSRYLIEALSDESEFEGQEGDITKIMFTKTLQR